MSCMQLSIYCCHSVQAAAPSAVFLSGVTEPFVWHYDTKLWELFFHFVFYENLENYAVLEKLPRLLIRWRINPTSSYLAETQAGNAIEIAEVGTLCSF